MEGHGRCITFAGFILYHTLAARAREVLPAHPSASAMGYPTTSADGLTSINPHSGAKQLYFNDWKRRFETVEIAGVGCAHVTLSMPYLRKVRYHGWQFPSRVGILPSLWK